MGERLDQAALRSAKVAKAVGRTRFARQFGENVRFMRRVMGAGAAAALSEATSEPPVVVPPCRALAADPHPGLQRQPAASFVDGDDERCTCRGTGATWCGATKGDVVHDLMSHGQRLDRDRAEALWRDAQTARAAL
ncbi:hypothetical protein [Frondihabitans australicus]|uniref:Uncharacterized protein n=1 Tax=Frondihabitans australicus TaxID=386892 RepID=A0A495IEL7_9MICO|nr:hypothetical protein [Frondihabitans australicus]RKR73585.1 hypothetical protein C8E83_0678 [Frondihabitans australicus]